MFPSIRDLIKLEFYKNRSLAELHGIVINAVEILSLEPITYDVHNTKIVLKVDQWEGVDVLQRPILHYAERIGFYNRLNLKELLLGVGAITESTDTVIVSLNRQGYDFNHDDIELIGDSIIAKEYSLGYIGAITTEEIGEYVPPVVIEPPVPAVVVSVSSDAKPEGGTLVHEVVLNKVLTIATGVVIAVTYNGSAALGTDTGLIEYNIGFGWVNTGMSSGSFAVAVPVGVDRFSIRILTVEDTYFESDETYLVSAKVINQDPVFGTGTILNNDPVPVISINDTSVTEGGLIEHTVTLSTPSASVSSYPASLVGITATNTLDFNANLAQATLTNGVTYNPANQTLVIPALVTSFKVSYTTVDDNVNESVETVEFRLGNKVAIGTIFDNDTLPSISVNNIEVTESVDSHAVFNVTLSHPMSTNVQFTAMVINGSAVMGQDIRDLMYQNGAVWVNASNTPITIPAGETTARVRVTIDDDNVFEPNKSFTLAVTVVGNVLANEIANGLCVITSNDPAPTLLTEVQQIDRFDPLYWRIDGPQTASFSITDYQNGWEALFQCRQTDDLVGIIWDSENTKDHKYLAYETNTDYRNLVWDFDIELSPSMPVLSDPQYAPTLTIVYYNEAGFKSYAYVALWNYADNPNSRAAHIQINWNNIRGGYAADIPFTPYDVRQIFFSGYVTGYDKANVSKFDETKEGFLRVTNSIVSGSNSKLNINRVLVPQHDIGMCTSYDDHYDLNPRRIVNNLEYLGYNGFINHYCGMSHYPVINWNASLNRFEIPDTLITGETVVNPACRKWHEQYAKALHEANMEPVFSVSWELYSLGARETWCQREWNDTIGRTGYEPPSYFMSMCHENAIAYIHKAYREFADTLIFGGCEVIMQIGEPWWWFNVASLNPCVYDYQTRLAFNADTGLYAPNFGTIYEAVDKVGTPYDEFKLWLRNKLGQTCQDIRTMLKDTYGDNAKVCPLIFFPSIRTHQPSLATYINYPQEYYAYPNFDFIMTEAYDWVIEQPPRLDLSHQAVNEIPIAELGYPVDKIAYLSGFVPDAMIAYIYKFDYESNYRKPIWQRIFGDIKNNNPVGIWKQLAWAYPQVMYDSLTIDTDRAPRGFFMAEEYVKPISDNTPYPVDIFDSATQPPQPSPIQQPVNVVAVKNEWGDVHISFDVNNYKYGTKFEVQILNTTGVYPLWRKTTKDTFVSISISELVASGISGSLKIVVIPDDGDNSVVLDIDPVLDNGFVSTVIFFAGQSHAVAHFTEMSGNNSRHDLVSATTLRNAYAEGKGIHPATVLPVLIAWGGSAADKLAQVDSNVNDTNYWYDLDNDVDGPRLTQALNIMSQYTSVPNKLLLWSQGSADADASGSASPYLSDTTRYSTASNKILTKLLSALPESTKVYWQILGRKYTGVVPKEVFGIERYNYRQTQILLINSIPDYVVGSWTLGGERSSGYINEQNIWAHHTQTVYHSIAADIGEAMGNEIDRIDSPPSWISLAPVQNVSATHSGEDIVLSWDLSMSYDKYVINQFNVLDGSTIYTREVTGTSDTFTAAEQRAVYGYTAGTISATVVGYDSISDTYGPTVTYNQPL